MNGDATKHNDRMVECAEAIHQRLALVGINHDAYARIMSDGLQPETMVICRDVHDVSIHKEYGKAVPLSPQKLRSHGGPVVVTPLALRDLIDGLLQKISQLESQLCSELAPARTLDLGKAVQPTYSLLQEQAMFEFIGSSVADENHA